MGERLREDRVKLVGVGERKEGEVDGVQEADQV